MDGKPVNSLPVRESIVRSLDSFVFPEQDVLLQRFSREHPLEKAPEVFREYRRFLELKVVLSDYGATELSPSLLVDAMWHLHVLDTSRHYDTCSKLPGIIHHNPDGADNEEARARRYQSTLLVYRARSGEQPPREFWPLEVDLQEQEFNRLERESRSRLEEIARAFRVKLASPSRREQVPPSSSVANLLVKSLSGRTATLAGVFVFVEDVMFAIEKLWEIPVTGRGWCFQANNWKSGVRYLITGFLMDRCSTFVFS